MKPYTLLAVLLSSSIFTAASPLVTAIPNREKGEFSSQGSFDAPSLNATSPLHPLRRRALRSPQFMEYTLKGATYWDEYQQKLNEFKEGNYAGDPVIDIPMDFNPRPKSPHSPAKKGWQWHSEWKEWVESAEDQDGWRYRTTGVIMSDALIQALSLIGMTGSEAVLASQFKAYNAMEWRNPQWELEMAFDCEKGIMVVVNSKFVAVADDSDSDFDSDFDMDSDFDPDFDDYASDSSKRSDPKPDRSDYRWSDVAWVLYQTVCPAHRTNLRYIIRWWISNDETMRRLQEVASFKGLDEKNLPASDKKSFLWTPTPLSKPITRNSCNEEKGDCDFYYLLHSPNAIGTLYFSKSHIDDLDNNLISRIRGQSLWNDSGDELRWNMIVEFESGCA